LEFEKYRPQVNFKLHCDERFTHAFTACGCIFREITLVGSNQGNYFENATVCSNRTLKTKVATQFQAQKAQYYCNMNLEPITCYYIFLDLEINAVLERQVECEFQLINNFLQFRKGKSLNLLIWFWFKVF